MVENRFIQKIKVEHNIPSYFNDKNKKIILFLSSLVGKKLNYKAQDNGVIDPLEPVLEYLYDQTEGN